MPSAFPITTPPLSVYDAKTNLAEELSDVMTMAYMLGILPGVFYPSDEKMERWVKRLRKLPKQRVGKQRSEED